MTLHTLPAHAPPRTAPVRGVLFVLLTALVAAVLVAAPSAPGHAAAPAPATTVGTTATGSYLAPHCERVDGVLRCGLKYTNTESKVLVAAAIGALAGGGTAACGVSVPCKILVASVGAALTTWWTAITRYDRCLFSYTTGISSRFTLVRC